MFFNLAAKQQQNKFPSKNISKIFGGKIQAFYAFGIGGAVTILGYVYVETDHALLHKWLWRCDIHQAGIV